MDPKGDYNDSSPSPSAYWPNQQRQQWTEAQVTSSSTIAETIGVDVQAEFPLSPFSHSLSNTSSPPLSSTSGSSCIKYENLQSGLDFKNEIDEDKQLEPEITTKIKSSGINVCKFEAGSPSPRSAEKYHSYKGHKEFSPSSYQGIQNLSRSLIIGTEFPTNSLTELSGELAMSLSPKHTTPFSVTDILSPLEESYRLKALEVVPHMNSATSTATSLASYLSNNNNNNSSVSSTNNSKNSQFSPTTANNLNSAMNVSAGSPYTHMHMSQLSHPGAAAAAFQAQYCNGTADLHGMTSHYGDVRSSASAAAAGWYGASATDPRFASKSIKR